MFAVINFALMLTVLFSMLFQSLHSYEHIAAQFSEKNCNHETSINKAEITHHHHVGEHCFVCEFTLSNYIAPHTYSFVVNFSFEAIPYYFTKSTTPQYFSGSALQYRGPPSFIV